MFNISLNTDSELHFNINLIAADDSDTNVSLVTSDSDVGNVLLTDSDTVISLSLLEVGPRQTVENVTNNTFDNRVYNYTQHIDSDWVIREIIDQNTQRNLDSDLIIMTVEDVLGTNIINQTVVRGFADSDYIQTVDIIESQLENYVNTGSGVSETFYQRIYDSDTVVHTVNTKIDDPSSFIYTMDSDTKAPPSDLIGQYSFVSQRSAT